MLWMFQPLSILTPPADVSLQCPPTAALLLSHFPRLRCCVRGTNLTNPGKIRGRHPRELTSLQQRERSSRNPCRAELGGCSGQGEQSSLPELCPVPRAGTEVVPGQWHRAMGSSLAVSACSMAEAVRAPPWHFAGCCHSPHSGFCGRGGHRVDME